MLPNREEKTRHGETNVTPGDAMSGFAGLIETIVHDPARELEWLDMLSQLEYVGCRKILKSVPFDRISVEVLQHVSEEASHAYLLKDVVEKHGADRKSWAANPLAEIGWRYFQALDQEISRLPGVAGLNYPAVSWAVEQRVLKVYPIYLAATKSNDVKRAVSRILAQERRHGGQFDAAEFPDGLREKMLQIEESLWARFVSELSSRLNEEARDAVAERFDFRVEYELRATD